MNLERTRRGLVAVAVGASLVVAPASHRAPAAVTTAQIPHVTSPTPDGCVKTIPVKSTDSITPEGVETKLTPGLATVYHYDTGNPNDDGHEIVPPDGWTPLNATAQELKAYGFPPRPAASDTEALTQWTSNMSTWTTAGAPEMCQTDTNDGITHTEYSRTWAGNMVVNGTTNVSTLWTTDNKWTQPAFSSSGQCSSAQYAVWGGLGGEGGHLGRLMQSGVQTLSNLTQYMFWQVISTAPAHNSYVVMWSDFTIGGGDDLESWVSYDLSTGTATLYVADHTLGKSHSYVFSVYDGQAASGYWDGTTAEVISEEPTGGPTGLWNLLKPNTSQILIYYATVNGQPIANFSSWAMNQDHPAGHHVQTTNTDGAHPFYNTWLQCS